MKHKLPWSKVSREDVEKCARKFQSVAASNVLKAAEEFAEPLFFSLHVAAFCVIERKDAYSIFKTGTASNRAKIAAGQRRRWAKTTETR